MQSSGRPARGLREGQAGGEEQGEQDEDTHT